MERVVRLSGLYRYPIKACAGAPLAVAPVDARGIAHDREFMVVDAPSGDFLTQREEPRLALVRPELAPGGLRLHAPGMPPLDVARLTRGQLRPVRVWRDRCPAVDQGEQVAGWLSDFLGRPVRLVRMADDHVRHVDPVYARTPRDRVGFADAFPFLLISEESLADLNRRLPSPLPMNRFRPNLVVAGGGEPYLEDRWRTLVIGELRLHVAKACARCVTTTTDQETAERGAEPLVTLAGYRRVSRGVLFGQNLLHEAPGELRRGERVDVLAWAGDRMASAPGARGARGGS